MESDIISKERKTVHKNSFYTSIELAITKNGAESAHDSFYFF